MVGYGDDSPGFIDEKDQDASDRAPDSEGKRPNMKKKAIKKVLDAIDSAETDLELDPAAPESPQAKYTKGLGTGGSVWDSSFAETTRETISTILATIGSEFTGVRHNVSVQHQAEPEKVDNGDSRADWDVL